MAGSLAFEINPDLAMRVHLSAKAMSTSVQTVLSAAAAWALARRLDAPLLINHSPVTQRRTDAEFASIGCFVANLPVVFVPPQPSCPVGDIVRGWRNGVAALLDLADADPVRLEEMLQTETTEWERTLRVSIAAERRFSDETGPIAWRMRPPVPGAPKYDLAWMFSIGHPQEYVSAQIVAGPEFTGLDLPGLERAFSATLAAICRGGRQAPRIGASWRAGKRRVSPAPRPSMRDVVAGAVGQPDEQIIGLASTVADACSDTLGVTVEADEDLFLSGLKSLSALKLVARLHALGHADIRASDIYEFRTPMGIARYITAQNFLR